MADTDKVVVLKTAPRELTVIVKADVGDIHKSLGDPVIGTIDTTNTDEHMVKIKNIAGETQSIHKKNVVKIEPYSVFNSAVVTGAMNAAKAAGRAVALSRPGP